MGVLLWVAEFVLRSKRVVQLEKNVMTTYIERALRSGLIECVLSYESLRVSFRDRSLIELISLRTLKEAIWAQNPPGYGREGFALFLTTVGTLTSMVTRQATLKSKSFHQKNLSSTFFFWSRFHPATNTNVQTQREEIIEGNNYPPL